MFKKIILALAATGCCLAGHCKQADQTADRYFYLPELSNDEIEQLLKEPGVHDVLVCPAGTRLPMNFLFKGDLAELESSKEGTHHLVLKHTFYLRLENEQILISLDGNVWKQWDELLTGMISVALTHSEGSPQLHLSGEARIREPSQNPLDK